MRGVMKYGYWGNLKVMELEAKIEELQREKFK
jgi:hypothetical protein